MLKANHGIFSGAIHRAATEFKTQSGSVTSDTIFLGMDVTIDTSNTGLTVTGGDSDSGQTVIYNPTTGYFEAPGNGSYAYDSVFNDWFFVNGSSAGLACRYIRSGSDTGWTSYLAFDRYNGFETAIYRASISANIWTEIEGSGGNVIFRVTNTVTRTFGSDFSMRFNGPPG